VPAPDPVAPDAGSRRDDDPGDGQPSLLEVGRVVRAHGLSGEVEVELWTDRPERVAAGAVFSAAGGRTLHVVRSRPHRRRHLVVFEGVDDRDSAEALRGATLEAPPLDEPDTIWVHELVGARVTTVDGRPVGVVAAVEANPASDLLVLADGGLIPLVFVVEHRPGEQVTVDLPAGLLDL
jgi:16S rRNA processing protein RimM